MAKLQGKVGSGSGDDPEVQILHEKDWLVASGEMAESIRTMDWSTTPLGPRDSWPQTLRTIVNVVLASSFPMAILWGSELIFVYNDGYRVIAGGNHPRALGHSNREVWPEVWDFNRPIFEKVMTRGETVHLENQLFRIFRNGYMEDAYFTLSYSPIHIENGSIGGTLVTLLERTEAVQATLKLPEAVREEKDRLSSLIGSISDEVWFADTEGRFTLVNPAARREFGIDGNVAVEKLANAVEVYNPDGTPRAVEEAPPLRALRGEIVLNQEEIIKTPATGELRHRQVSSTPVRNAAGAIIGSVSVVRDITDRKRAEEELRESEERFRVAQKLSPDGFLIFRPLRDNRGFVTDFLWIYENEAAARMNDTDPKEVCGKRVSHILPHHDESLFHKAYKEVAETGEVRVVEQTFYDQDTFRQRRWFRAVAVPTAGGDVAVLVQNTTERKLAEEALRESEDRLRLALEAADLGTWDLDLITGKAVRSLRHDQIFGYHELQPEWTLEIALRHVLPEDREMVREAHARPDQTGGMSVEVRVRQPDGCFRWITSRGRFHYDSAGRPVRIVGVVADITERKQAEEALHQSRENLNRAEEVGQIGWWRLDTQRNILTWSDENHRIFGVPKGTPLTYEVFLNCVHPEDRGYVHAQWSAGMRGEPYDIEHRLVADGQVKWVHEKAYLELDGTGKLLGGFGITQDITERKRAEEALREAKEELELRVRERTAELTEALQTLHLTSAYTRSLIESSLDPLVTIGRDGTITDVNAAAETATGRGRQELIGTDFCTYFTQPEMARTGYLQVFKEGSVRDYPLEICHRDGHTIPVLYNAALYRDEAGRVVGIFAAARDITERKRAEDALRRSDEQLRRITSELMVAEQRERQKLAQVLHDGLQQILVGAKYRLALLERGNDLQQTTGQVGELIDDAIETSRSLSAELSPPILHQGDFVAALEWLSRWMHDKHGIEVNLTARARIAHLQEDAILLLFQAARELLLNVVKHAGVKNAYIELNQLDGHVSMTVEDKGAGFDQNMLAHQGGQSSGTGLYGIIQRLSYIGGRIEIHSAPGLGSRFRLIVPVPEANAEVDQRTIGTKARVSVAITAQPDSKSGVEKKIRIALVDDHIVVRQGLAGLLRAEPDIEIIGEASDGQSAIDLIRDLRPDVVLMDINMPGMDGIQATRIIHKEHPEVRVIGLSMFQEGEQQAAMHEAGAVNYLTKIGPSEGLIEAIRACVRVSGKSPSDKPAKRADQKSRTETSC